MPDIDMRRLRAWWWSRQGLDGAFDGAGAAVILGALGWARSVGGANPYLSLFARARISRSKVDAEVADLKVYELPAARGCTYVVPEPDFGLALQVGRRAAEVDVAKAEKLGVPRQEIDDLSSAVVDTVADRALDPAALKEILGDAVRNLGPEGRKKGLSTTLPIALGLAQSTGHIRRIPLEGRLDRQRFAYIQWTPPQTGLTDAEATVELARRYFEWTAGASPTHLRWFTGFSAKDTKAAMAQLNLVEIEPGIFAPRVESQEYEGFRPPVRRQYRLLAGIDALVLLRRDLPTLFEPGDAVLPVPGESGTTLGSLTDLPDMPIVERGRVIGLWQYDPDTERIVWWCFDEELALDRQLWSEVDRVQDFIRDELGDARSFSLDSPKSRAPRISALRAASTA